MDKSVIIIIAFVGATAIMLLKELIIDRWNAHMYKVMAKRISEVRDKIQNGEDIPSIIIDLDKEPNRMQQPENHKGLIIDGQLYDEKNSCFMQKDGRIHIIGRKEDFIITLVKKSISEF